MSLSLSSPRLRHLDAVVASAINDGVIAGAVTLVAHKGAVVSVQAQGQLDVAAGRAMRPDAIFRLASLTKPVTAAALLALVEEGKLLLSDPVAAFLPGFDRFTVAGDAEPVPAARPIAIRDLLAHTSGLGSAPGPISVADLPPGVAPGDSLADVVPRFASLPLRFQPGSAFRYSPEIGFDALGRIIEVVSGESLDAFVRARLLEPIGARDLWFHVPADRLGDVATLYARTPDGLRPVAPHGAHALTTVPDSRYCSASGGMAGTAESYARFALMLAGRGQLDGRRVLAPRSVALMASNHIGRLPAQSIVLDLRGYRIGLGVRVLEDPAEAGSLASPGTFGWSGLYGTYLWIDPVEELVGILLVQRALDLQDQALGRLAPRVENAIFQALE